MSVFELNTNFKTRPLPSSDGKKIEPEKFEMTIKSLKLNYEGKKTDLVDLTCKDRIGEYTVKPVLKTTKKFINELCSHMYRYKDKNLVKFGEYPQDIVSNIMQRKLTYLLESNIFKNKIKKIQESYHLNNKPDLINCNYLKYPVYEYKNNKYIAIPAKNIKNSNYKYKKYVWLQICPIEWQINTKNNLLISTEGLLSMFVCITNMFDKESDLYNFLNNIMLKDILQSENIEYELFNDEESEKIEQEDNLNNNYINLINDIEYNLSNLKDINNDLYIKYKEEYDNYIKNNITDITTLGYLNGRILADISINKERPIDLIKYLEDLKEELLNNFINNNEVKIDLSFNKLDKIYELFLNKEKNYNAEDKIEILRNISLIYLLEVYNNKNKIKLDELNKTNFKYQLKNIILWIKYFLEQDIITCSYFLSLIDDINSKTVFDMIKSIEFKNKKERKLIR